LEIGDWRPEIGRWKLEALIVMPGGARHLVLSRATTPLVRCMPYTVAAFVVGTMKKKRRPIDSPFLFRGRADSTDQGLLSTLVSKLYRHNFLRILGLGRPSRSWQTRQACSVNDLPNRKRQINRIEHSFHRTAIAQARRASADDAALVSEWTTRAMEGFFLFKSLAADGRSTTYLRISGR
jgi:hypothetical protein